jgi:hypothetical protein
MATFDKKTNTYLLSKLDKFRLFAIKHKSVEWIAVFSNFLMPFAASLFSISYGAFLIGFFDWWILRFDNTACFVISTILHWVLGIVLGIAGKAPPIIWIMYIPLFVNAVYYLICELLDHQETKRGETTPLEILYKQHKI